MLRRTTGFRAGVRVLADVADELPAALRDAPRLTALLFFAVLPGFAALPDALA